MDAGRTGRGAGSAAPAERTRRRAEHDRDGNADCRPLGRRCASPSSSSGRRPTATTWSFGRQRRPPSTASRDRVPAPTLREAIPGVSVYDVELAGSRAAWVSASGCGNFCDFTMQSATLSQRSPSVVAATSAESDTAFDFHLHGHSELLVFNDGSRAPPHRAPGRRVSVERASAAVEVHPSAPGRPCRVGGHRLRLADCGPRTRCGGGPRRARRRRPASFPSRPTRCAPRGWTAIAS